MNVLVGCEFSGVVRRAFAERGHEAWSCDLLPAEDGDPRHLQADLVEVLKEGYGWHLAIFHPPCTHLAVSGARWFVEKRAEQEAALQFVRTLMNAPIHRIALENPVSIISSKIRKPDQIIQPWMFGHDASKKTCLWLKNLSKLQPTEVLKKERYANQTPSGQNKLGPSPTRAQERSRTYEGIAAAMAQQWGG
jgi:hypothetical protein